MRLVKVQKQIMAGLSAEKSRLSFSPDLNPIENLWGLLTRKVFINGRQFRTKEELNHFETSILKSWDEIMETECQTLTESMQNRIFQVILLKGAKTKY